MGMFDFFFKTAGLNKLGNTRAYNEEYSTEMYDKTFNTSDMPPYNSYSQNGIHVTKTEDRIKLVYDGILAKSGAESVYAVVGYGKNNNWQDTKYYQMNRTGDRSFELSIPIDGQETIYLAFKDNAENWDNNSGSNYSFNNSFYGSH